MSATTPNLLPDEFVVIPSRVVFDQHVERGADGTVSRSFGETELQEIARRCAARDARGAWCPLTIGHTAPGRPEHEQPQSVGYARNWRVGPDPVSGQPALLADFWFKQEHYAEAATYARVSVELWPGDWVIDPVALLRRTPRLDIPQWLYGRATVGPRAGKPVIRYSREATMPQPAPPPGGGMGGAPPSPTNAMPAPGGGDMSAKAMDYARHCLSHQYAKELTNHFGSGGDAPPGGAPPMPPLGAEPPMQPPGAPPDQFSRDATIANLQAQLHALQRENRLAARRQDLQALAEKVELDVEEELAELGDLEPARYQRELTRIENRYAPRADAPTPGGGLVPILGSEEETVEHPTPYSRKPGVVGRFVANGALTREGAREIQRYMRDHPEHETYERAREAFIREQTGAAPAHAKNGRN